MKLNYQIIGVITQVWLNIRDRSGSRKAIWKPFLSCGSYCTKHVPFYWPVT